MNATGPERTGNGLTVPVSVWRRAHRGKRSDGYGGRPGRVDIRLLLNRGGRARVGKGRGGEKIITVRRVFTGDATDVRTFFFREKHSSAPPRGDTRQVLESAPPGAVSDESPPRSGDAFVPAISRTDNEKFVRI